MMIFSYYGSRNIFHHFCSYQQLILLSNGHEYKHSLWVVSFGIASVPPIFQQTMESLLQGLSGVYAYLDNMQVSWSTVKKHLNHLDAEFCKFNASCFIYQRKKSVCLWYLM